MYKSIGMDLGASRLVVSAAEEGILYARGAEAAFRGTDGILLESGEDGCRFGKTEGGEPLPSVFHENTAVPACLGDVISEGLAVHGDGGACRQILFSIPCSFGEVEENALAEMAMTAGAEAVYLVYSPLAALAGNDIALTTSAIVVDIGAMQTNILVICRGRIIVKKTYPIGGNHFDKAIVSYLLRHHKVEIDARAAETIKKQIGTVWISNEKQSVDMRGRDITNGDYCTVRVSSEEMFTALEEPMAAFIDGICKTVTRIPADCVQDVFDTGILLAGGGCLLDGIDKMLSGVTGIDTARLHNPRETVAKGLASILTDSNLSLAGTRNISRYIMKMSAVPKRGTKE